MVTRRASTTVICAMPAQGREDPSICAMHTHRHTSPLPRAVVTVTTTPRLLHLRLLLPCHDVAERQLQAPMAVCAMSASGKKASEFLRLLLEQHLDARSTKSQARSLLLGQEIKIFEMNSHD